MHTDQSDLLTKITHIGPKLLCTEKADSVQNIFVIVCPFGGGGEGVEV